MDDPQAEDRPEDLIGRLFAVVTAKLEDGAAIAVEGQAPELQSNQQCTLAGRLVEVGCDVVALAEAIEALAGRRN